MRQQRDPATPAQTILSRPSTAATERVTASMTAKRDEQVVQQDTADEPVAGPEPKLRVTDLRAGFGEREVLHGISVSFPANTITALIGPTGCGKSTFLRTLNRLNDLVAGFHWSGQIELDGLDVNRQVSDVRELRRRVGMLFQRPNPFPQSIRANIAIGLRTHRIVSRGAVEQQVQRQLEEVGLWDAVHDKLDASPFGLSGGQQQLLCLARTLAVQPEVILLDEPTSSLDPISTQRVEDLLRRLKERITIIMVTHNLQQASRIADRVVFLYDGRLVETDEAEEFFLRPKNKLTEDFITGRIG